jgi:hypothetical protein
MTLRASIQHHKKEHYEQLRGVYERCLWGGFLFPDNYAGCEHQYVALDSGFCVCRDCGRMHICCKGQCPDVLSDNGERVCVITGCVTSENEMRPERNATERVGMTSGGSHRGDELTKRFIPPMGSTHLWETIQHVVEELLTSDKTKVCAVQERERYEGKEQSCFCRIVRDLAQNKKTNGMRPNELHILSMVYRRARNTGNATGEAYV